MYERRRSRSWAWIQEYWRRRRRSSDPLQSVGGDFNLDLRILQLQSVHGVDELGIRQLQAVTILQDLHDVP